MIYQIPATQDNVRTFKDPNSLEKRRTLIALVRLSDLPELPLNPDPRVPQRRGKIVNTIRESALTNDGHFHEKNRGITLCVQSADFDNKTKTLHLNIPDDEGVYGIVDGGHTHFAIHDAIHEAVKKVPRTAKVEEVLPNQYVRLEIMVGVEENLAEIAWARNFSESLRPWTLENYQGKFEWLKKALGGKVEWVRFRENEDQPVPVLDVIQILCILNLKLYPNENISPVEAYSNLGKCLNYFVAENDPYSFQSYSTIVLDMLKLYDWIRFHWGAKYDEVDEQGKRGRIKQRGEMSRRQRNRDHLLTFYFLERDQSVQTDGFAVEKGIAVPVLSGFRVLLTQDTKTGMYKWIQDPFEFFIKHGKKLVTEVMEASNRKGGDMHSVGRDREIYRNIYRIVKLELLTDMMHDTPNKSEMQSLFS